MTEEVKDNVWNERLDTLKLEYKEFHSYWRTLTDIRFKLLAFVPTVAGLGVTFSTKTTEPLEAFAVGLLGFIATLGITFYDQRNSELYNAAINIAALLEEKMKFEGGTFLSRPDPGRKFFGILMWHDRALAMVYASALGAWLFIIISSILKLILWSSGTFSLLLSVLLAIVIYKNLYKPRRSGNLERGTSRRGDTNYQKTD
jgi:hypothetical protein